MNEMHDKMIEKRENGVEENERKYRIEIYIENMKLDGSRDVEL